MRLTLPLVVLLLSLLASLVWAQEAPALGTFMDTPAPNLQLANLSPPVAAAETPLVALKQTAASSGRWLSEGRWAAFKGVNGVADFGAGYSVNLYRVTDKSSVWLDLAPYYEGASERLSGLVGVSTEIAPIPVLGPLLAPLQAMTGDTLNRIGAGWYVPADGRGGAVVYVAVDF
jgi:hypothetical protein